MIAFNIFILPSVKNNVAHPRYRVNAVQDGCRSRLTYTNKLGYNLASFTDTQLKFDVVTDNRSDGFAKISEHLFLGLTTTQDGFERRTTYRFELFLYSVMF